MHHLKTCSSVLLLPLADGRWLEHPPRQADRRSWRRRRPSWLVGVAGTAVFTGKFRWALSFLELKKELNKEHAKAHAPDGCSVAHQMLRFGRAAATAIEEAAVLVVCRDSPSAAFSFKHEHRSTSRSDQLR